LRLTSSILQDQPVGVDYYWRRTDPESVRDLEPLELRPLVPYWFDDRFGPETEARITVRAVDTGALIGRLLRLGAADDSDDYSAWLATDGADGLDGHYMIGVLRPDDVSRITEFLSRVQPEAWMAESRPTLAEVASDLGCRTPFDDDWAQSVVWGIKELTELFTLADAAGEAVIVMVVA
jgi:hypothetical protein